MVSTPDNVNSKFKCLQFTMTQMMYLLGVGVSVSLDCSRFRCRRFLTAVLLIPSVVGQSEHEEELTTS